MIAATNAITPDCLSHAEGCVAMRATVFERLGDAIAPSPKNKVLPAHHSGGDRADLEIGRVYRAIPIIADPIAHTPLPPITMAGPPTPLGSRPASAIISARYASLVG